MIRVSVNGYGTIGRRVADAVSAQPDMTLVGVAKMKPDYRARLAIEKGYKLYAGDEKSQSLFRDSGLVCSGTARDLVSDSDIVVDATPEDVGAQNKKMYEELGKSAIFQGGEEDETAGMSFVAQCNYEKAKGRRFVRVVSCNSTALCRVLNAVDQECGISKARVVIARRAADPDEVGKGPIDAVVLDPITLPSHHGPDVNTVLTGFPVISMALKIPTTHMHLHSLLISLKDGGVSKEKISEKFAKTPRLMLVEGKKEGFKSTANIIDLAREMGRSRNDVYESVVWKDSIAVLDGELYFFMAVHQEAIVVPENIDAIRAMFGETSREESMATTNRSLGIKR
jgi:glyceraldehyde-3-phosphate dehydrogenase (NAD(P))